ncbi:MAG: hypothetical protein HC836_24660 [Richelia sp. RM2_1_2]|nr:hypothetical protein [Richelia sp. RM2_1_2]
MRTYCPDCGAEPLTFDEVGFEICTRCWWTERDLFTDEEVEDMETLAWQVDMSEFHDRCEHGISIHDDCDDCNEKLVMGEGRV